MSDHWKETEQRRRPLLEQPWLWFGMALILAVAAVIFATLTWLIQSHHVSAITRESERLVDEGVAEYREELEEAESTIASLRAERQRLKRMEKDLQHMIEHDESPSSLPPAELSDLLGKDGTLTVHMNIEEPEAEEPDARLGPRSRSELETHLHRQIEEHGLHVADDKGAESVLYLNLVVAELGRDVVTIFATLRVDRMWKVPGESLSFQASIWTDYHIAVAEEDRAMIMAEETVEKLVSRLGGEL